MGIELLNSCPDFSVIERSHTTTKEIFIDSTCVISWLGIDEGKFKPVVAVYDLNTKKVINRYIFDESFDNHGVPSLAVDNEKIIHLDKYGKRVGESTVKLTSANIDDRNVAFPTVFPDKEKPGRWRDYSPDVRDEKGNPITLTKQQVMKLLFKVVRNNSNKKINFHKNKYTGHEIISFILPKDLKIDSI